MTRAGLCVYLAVAATNEVGDIGVRTSVGRSDCPSEPGTEEAWKMGALNIAGRKTGSQSARRNRCGRESFRPQFSHRADSRAPLPVVNFFCTALFVDDDRHAAPASSTDSSFLPSSSILLLSFTFFFFFDVQDFFFVVASRFVLRRCPMCSGR